MKNILVIYYVPVAFELRKNTRDHIFSFREEAGAHVYFCNAYCTLPNYLNHIRFNLVIFHVTFSTFIQCATEYEAALPSYRNIKGIAAPKVLLIQDEHHNAQRLCRFINELEIGTVFSVSPESEWRNIYKDIDFNKVKFLSSLTGYLENEIEKTAQILENEGIQRSIDIGYRAWKAEYFVGRHGLLKLKIGEEFQKKLENKGYQLDICTNPTSTFYGLDWYRFLSRCRYVIGAEGGSSLLDYDGSLKVKVKEFMAAHPAASFEECEAACFPNQDGELNYFAISPRHLEACVTKTCQILVEGDFNGILKPWVHYIPLKKDFSNLNEIVAVLGDEAMRQRIVQRAYEDIVLSRKYCSNSFVQTVLRCADNGSSPNSPILYLLHKIREKMIPKMIKLDLRNRIKSSLPPPVVEMIKRIKNRI